MTVARAHGGEGEPARDRDRRRTAGCTVALLRSSRRPVAELAEIVDARTVGGPAARHAARVKVARAHGGKGEPARNRDRRGAAGGRAVAELAALVPTPPVAGSAALQAAPALFPPAHGGEGEPARDRDRGRTAGYTQALLRSSRRAVAELAENV